jgi:chaperonin GroES
MPIKRGVNLRMLESRVAVEPEQAPDQTDSGLYLPENREERLQMGRVLSVGPDTRDLEEGDRVCFGAYAGTEIDLPGKQFVVLEQSEIMAKVAEGVGAFSTSLSVNYSDEI